MPVLDMKPRFINPYKQNITMVFHIFPAVFKLCLSTWNWKLINSSHCWWFCCWLNIRKSTEDIGFGYIPYWKSAKDEVHSERLEWTSPAELIVQRQPCPGKPASCKVWQEVSTWCILSRSRPLILSRSRPLILWLMPSWHRPKSLH